MHPGTSNFPGTLHQTSSAERANPLNNHRSPLCTATASVLCQPFIWQPPSSCSYEITTLYYRTLSLHFMLSAQYIRLKWHEKSRYLWVSGERNCMRLKAIIVWQWYRSPLTNISSVVVDVICAACLSSSKNRLAGRWNRNAAEHV